MFDSLHISTHATPPEAVADSPAGALPVCTISVQRHPGWTAVMLRGELDRPSAADLRATVAEQLEEDQPVIIELVGLEFSDVNGIRALADLVRRGELCRGHGGVEVHGARGQVARLIALLGLDDLLMPPVVPPVAPRQPGS